MTEIDFDKAFKIFHLFAVSSSADENNNHHHSNNSSSNNNNNNAKYIPITFILPATRELGYYPSLAIVNDFIERRAKAYKSKVNKDSSGGDSGSKRNSITSPEEEELIYRGRFYFSQFIRFCEQLQLSKNFLSLVHHNNNNNNNNNKPKPIMNMDFIVRSALQVSQTQRNSTHFVTRDELRELLLHGNGGGGGGGGGKKSSSNATTSITRGEVDALLYLLDPKRQNKIKIETLSMLAFTQQQEEKEGRGDSGERTVKRNSENHSPDLFPTTSAVKNDNRGGGKVSPSYHDPQPVIPTPVPPSIVMSSRDFTSTTPAARALDFEAVNGEKSQRTRDTNNNNNNTKRKKETTTLQGPDSALVSSGPSPDRTVLVDASVSPPFSQHIKGGDVLFDLPCEVMENENDNQEGSKKKKKGRSSSSVTSEHRAQRASVHSMTQHSPPEVDLPKKKRRIRHKRRSHTLHSKDDDENEDERPSHRRSKRSTTRQESGTLHRTSHSPSVSPPAYPYSGGDYNSEEEEDMEGTRPHPDRQPHDTVIIDKRILKETLKEVNFVNGNNSVDPAARRSSGENREEEGTDSSDNNFPSVIKPGNGYPTAAETTTRVRKRKFDQLNYKVDAFPKERSNKSRLDCCDVM